MHVVVRAVSEPQFLFIRRQGDAVAGASVTLDRALIVTLHLDTIELLTGLDIADLEAKQIVHIHKAKCVASVHRKWTDYVSERPDTACDLVILRAGDRKSRGP